MKKFTLHLKSGNKVEFISESLVVTPFASGGLSKMEWDRSNGKGDKLLFIDPSEVAAITYRDA
jgi:hypothetical protein